MIAVERRIGGGEGLPEQLEGIVGGGGIGAGRFVKGGDGGVGGEEVVGQGGGVGGAKRPFAHGHKGNASRCINGSRNGRCLRLPMPHHGNDGGVEGEGNGRFSCQFHIPSIIQCHQRYPVPIHSARLIQLPHRQPRTVNDIIPNRPLPPFKRCHQPDFDHGRGAGAAKKEEQEEGENEELGIGNWELVSWARPLFIFGGSDAGMDDAA